MVKTRKDFDDAVLCAAEQGGGWTLLVAIADVSHYVKIGSALDRRSYYARTLGLFSGPRDSHVAGKTV